MGETLQVVPRQFTDEEWMDVIRAAMKGDLPLDLRRKVVGELLDIRANRRIRWEAINAQFTPRPPLQSKHQEPE